MRFRSATYLSVCLSFVGMTMFSSCQESLEDRAERESKEYTMKFCPTPPENDVITDSLVFDKKTKTQYYYLTFTGPIDDEEMISKNKSKLREGLLEQTRSNPQTKIYREAGFAWAYVCRSQKTGKVILDLKFSAKDMEKK